MLLLNDQFHRSYEHYPSHELSVRAARRYQLQQALREVRLQRQRKQRQDNRLRRLVKRFA